MSRTAAFLLAIALTLSLASCRSVSRPNWFNPGTAAHQQTQAEQYDPYPAVDPAPEILGARPREFQKPPPEASRNRWLPFNWGRS